jgi:hypothetical protein
MGRKPTPAQKRARRARKRKYRTIMLHGKKERIKRPVLIDGMIVDEYIERFADPIWLHQHALWHLIKPHGDCFNGGENDSVEVDRIEEMDFDELERGFPMDCENDRDDVDSIKDKYFTDCNRELTIDRAWIDDEDEEIPY